MKINYKAAQIYNSNKQKILKSWYNGNTVDELAEIYGLPVDYLSNILEIQEQKDIRKDFRDGVSFAELADMYDKTEDDIARILGIKI